MKKLTLLSLTAIILTTLTACKELTLEEVLSEAISATESLQSFQTTIDVSKGVIMDDQDDMSLTHTQTSVTNNPLTLEIHSEIGGEDGVDYVTNFSEEDGFYFKETTTDQWGKLSDDLVESFVTAPAFHTGSTTTTLNYFENQLSHLTMEETDTSYIISLQEDELNTDDFKKHLEELEFYNMDLGALDGISDLEDITYTITLDKETFYQTDINIEMKMMIDIIEVSQMITITLNDFNDIDPLEIPEEIKENATHIDY
ncbi:hypothetical protein HXZ66_16445 [Bacillus sp. A116_S68]|nr:hypothetical protein HXZ66_16445 [Bacillus sp. A116_S68]